MKIKTFNLKSDERLKKINKTIEEPLMKLNDHTLFVAPTNSGKSTIIANLLLNGLKNKFDVIHIFSPTYKYDLYDKLMYFDDENIHEEFDEDIINDILESKKKLEEDKNKNLYYLFIFDDYAHLFRKNHFMEKFITKCRHWGITIWLASQYVKGISPQTRAQFTCLICFPALSTEEDLKLISESAPESKKKFNEASEYVKNKIKEDKNPHHFLFINKKNIDKFYLDFSESIF